MSRDYKLNKSELTRLKRELKLFDQYLPVLKLKQEQLQLENLRVAKTLARALEKRKQAQEKINLFIPCLSDISSINILQIVKIKKISTTQKSVAGVKIQTLDKLSFQNISIPYFQSSPWLLRFLVPIKNFLHEEAHVCLLNKEQKIIKHELQKATQKVNLFEMVLIPKAQSAIKQIKISLGDEQVASVSRGKIAKNKKSQENLIEATL